MTLALLKLIVAFLTIGTWSGLMYGAGIRSERRMWERALKGGVR